MRNCIVCNSIQKEFIFDSSVTVPEPYPLLGKQYIVQCEDCGFVYGDSDNNLDSYKEYYSTLNKHKKRADDSKQLDESYFWRVSKFFEGLDKEARILDFGSGDLLMSNILSSKGFTNIETYDIGSDKPIGKFDFILSTHVFEHILDADQVIQEINDLLVEGGKLLIAVPDASRYNDCYYGPFNAFDLEHINHFTSASLKNLFLLNGFSIKDSVENAREVRPNLFYPEVVVLGEKVEKVKQAKLENDGEITKSKILEYIDRSSEEFTLGLSKINNRNDKRICIWGVGIWAMRLSNNIKTNNIKYFDIDSRLWGRNINGSVICSPSTLQENELNDCLVFVAAVNSGDIVKMISEKYGAYLETIAL